MPAMIVSGLEDHRKAQHAWGIVSPYVFTTFRGTPIDPRNALRQFKSLLKKAGLPDSIRFHDLRHSCATLLLAKGMNPKVIAELLGHSNAMLAVAVITENFTSGIGTVIYVAYLSGLCRNPLHTATQYALLTALASVGRIYLSSGAGFVAEVTGWPLFFVVSTMVAVPSLILLAWLQRRGHFNELGPVRV